VERGHAEISLRRQCELLGVNRSGLYYEPVGESKENLTLMRLLDEQFTRTPFYGSRRMTEWLATVGHPVNRKRVSRLMELLGIEAVYPKPQLSQPGEGHRIYPYLLRGTTVERVNQVWSTDITYIRMAQGFVYLVAVMDWFSRFVLSWALSLTMEVDFCIEALKRALRRGRPDIFNSDQGSQFTSEKFTGELAGHQIAISMDGRGRCMDNIFVERLWRSLKIRGGVLEGLRVGDGSARQHRPLLPVLQPPAPAPEPRLPDAVGDLPGLTSPTMSSRTIRKGSLLDSGTPSPNPWDLSLSRQNGCFTLKALERRIGLRRDATRAPIQGPEWQGAASPPPQTQTQDAAEH